MNNRQYQVALMCILRKEVSRFTRIWMQTLLPPAITMTLYFVIFGHLIGSRIGLMDGFSYMSFIVPGLIMMSVITNSYSNVASSFYSSKFQRNVEELLVAPLPSHIIIWGYVGGGVARGLCVGIIVTLVSLFFTQLHIHNVAVLLLSVILTAVLFALGGLINAIYANSFDNISIIPTFVLTPLTYLGGVFYSISLLPEFWQSVSQVNPIIYMVNTFRYGFLGVSDVPVSIALAMIMLFIGGLYFWAYSLIERGTGLRS